MFFRSSFATKPALKAVLPALLTTLLSLLFSTTANAGNPKANPAAEVVCGNARFTILTDRLVRMEWAEDGVFEDRASLAIINRELPVPAFKAVRKAGGVTISTGKLTLRYDGSGKFSPTNLSVSFPLNGKTMKWQPGADASANLMGTVRTLDRVNGRNGSKQLTTFNRGKKTNGTIDMEEGLLSRDGWAIVDESGRHLLEKNGSDWGEWVVERPSGERQDLYIFAYGHDYKAALADFTKVAGRIPMPPKYTLGYWWSRYWAYTDDEFLQIAEELRSHEVPADVFIIDMDWHLTWKELDKRKGRDEFGQKRGWTGYTWNRNLIENPEGLLADLHLMNFKTSLNLHPASGIRPYEDCYEDFVKDYLGRTNDYDGPKDYIYDDKEYIFKGNSKSVAKPGYKASVPFRMSQQAWADAYFASVIRPLEKQGVDFWWLDWQQWKESKYMPGLSNTFWLNWTFFNDKVRRSVSLGKKADRPFIYHRWGGLGSHRYQLGFSGDTYDEWSVLEMLPHFTASASNVGYGYWGHDIGGHMQQHTHDTDPEMYTRWLQYGVFTPIFKTHSTESAYLERKIWCYPSHFEYMREAINLRYALTPYIYNAARLAYDSGISICRPLYYEYPEEDMAYSCDQQFFFGDNILATVLCQPADPATGKTERRMWFPSGNDWYDMAHHCMYKGGSTKTLHYGIDENPWFVKAGAIIPLAAEGIQNLQKRDTRLRLMIVPGQGSSRLIHYEDDEVSQAYESDFATTLIEKKTSGKKVTVTIHPRKGSYEGAAQSRDWSIVMEGAEVASAFICRTDGAGSSCTKAELGAKGEVLLGQQPVESKLVVKITLK